MNQCSLCVVVYLLPSSAFSNGTKVTFVAKVVRVSWCTFPNEKLTTELQYSPFEKPPLLFKCRSSFSVANYVNLSLLINSGEFLLEYYHFGC